MPIRMSTGEVVYPITERERCPNCIRTLNVFGDKHETGALLSVTVTRPTDEPQVFERDYRCKRCGYTTTARYIMPRHPDDYLTEDELAARAEHKRLAGERLRAMRKG